MKPISRLLIAVFALTALSAASCADKDKVAGTAPAAPAVTPAPAPIVASPVQWTELKNYTYDQRDQLFHGLQLLVAKVDEQIGELNARRVVMVKNTVNTADWDFAMKEMGNARSYFQGMATELEKASPDEWNQEKDRVGRAWVRTQEAYAKVRASTTN